MVLVVGVGYGVGLKGCCCCCCWGDGVPGSEELVSLFSGRDGREGVVCVLPSGERLAHCS